jgi:thioredoxin 1
MSDLKEKKELLHFTADWCGPCQLMAPTIKVFEKENPEIEYVRIDIDEDPESFNYYSTKYGFTSIPAMIAMVDDLFYRSRFGSSTKAELVSLFD